MPDVYSGRRRAQMWIGVKCKANLKCCAHVASPPFTSPCIDIERRRRPQPLCLRLQQDTPRDTPTLHCPPAALLELIPSYSPPPAALAVFQPPFRVPEPPIRASLALSCSCRLSVCHHSTILLLPLRLPSPAAHACRPPRCCAACLYIVPPPLSSPDVAVHPIPHRRARSRHNSAHRTWT